MGNKLNVVVKKKLNVVVGKKLNVVVGKKLNVDGNLFMIVEIEVKVEYTEYKTKRHEDKPVLKHFSCAIQDISVSSELQLHNLTRVQ